MTRAAAGVFRALADRLDRIDAAVRQRASRLHALPGWRAIACDDGGVAGWQRPCPVTIAPASFSRPTNPWLTAS